MMKSKLFKLENNQNIKELSDAMKKISYSNEKIKYKPHVNYSAG